MKKHWPLLVVALLTVMGALLRLYGLRHRGVWWDEVSVWHDALSGHRSPQEAPLNTVLTRAVMWLMRRDDDYALHIPGVVFGTATIPAAYLLGHAVARRAAGLLLALLVTISPMLLAFSQEARPYPLLILMTTLQLGLAVMLLERWRSLVFFLLLLASAAALASHLVALPFTVAIGGILCLSQCARLVTDRAARRATLGHLAAIFVGGAAAIALGLSWTLSRPSFDSVMTGPYQYGLETFVRHVLAQCGPGFAGQQRPWGTIDEITGVYVALALVGVLALVLRRRLAVAAILLLPPLTLLVGLYLRLGEKSVWPWFRYATPTMVPFLAFVAAGITVRGRLLSAALMATLLCTHQNRETGLRAWAASAVIRRGAGYRDVANDLAAGNYAGTIFSHNPSVFGDETDRLTSSYAIFRHDALPAFYAPWSKPLRKIEYRKVIGKIPVPVRTEEDVADLPPGTYAVFLGWDSYRGCRYLFDKLRDPSPPVQSGTFIPCEMPAEQGVGSK